MRRRLAHRPRHNQTRTYSQPLNRSRREYLRQHWTYRQQQISYPKHSPGYGLALLPWGWRLVRDVVRRQQA
jgi:hypothetical protein